MKGGLLRGDVTYSSPYEFEGCIPLRMAIPLGIQHVLAMFVGNPAGRIDRLSAQYNPAEGTRRY